jgi:hypothetical protein
MPNPTPPDRSISKAQEAALTYKNTPKLRAFVEGLEAFLPGVTAANTYLVERLSQLERERTEALFAYLEEEGAELTPALIESDNFLHCFMITVRAAQRTLRKEKIRLFARLLASITKDQEQRISDVDEYEELLGILDDMSVREIRLLMSLDRFQQASGLNWTDLATADDEKVWSGFWNRAYRAIESDASVRSDDIAALLVRVSRTGLYQPFPALDEWGGRGSLTPRYYRLRDLIADAEGRLIEADPTA